MINYQGKTSSIWMPIIYTVVSCYSFCPRMDFVSSPVMRSLHLELEDLRDDYEDGYIYEVDLHYPTKLNNQHDDLYPLAPESLVIDRSMYSPTKQPVFSESVPQRKLTPNLRDKARYVVHYRNLKLYVQLGLVITKVHRVLTFKQSPWLKTYIDFNTQQRSLSDNGFLKDFFRLMNNSQFLSWNSNYRLLNCSTVQSADTNIEPSNLCWVYCVSKLHCLHMKVKYPHVHQLRLLFTVSRMQYRLKTFTRTWHQMQLPDMTSASTPKTIHSTIRQTGKPLGFSRMNLILLQ